MEHPLYCVPDLQLRGLPDHLLDSLARVPGECRSSYALQLRDQVAALRPPSSSILLQHPLQRLLHRAAMRVPQHHEHRWGRVRVAEAELHSHHDAVACAGLARRDDAAVDLDGVELPGRHVEDLLHGRVAIHATHDHRRGAEVRALRGFVDGRAHLAAERRVCLGHEAVVPLLEPRKDPGRPRLRGRAARHRFVLWARPGLFGTSDVQARARGRQTLRRPRRRRLVADPKAGCNHPGGRGVPRHVGHGKSNRAPQGGPGRIPAS
mmetsp:Transcript_24682/g.77637  ORF Transcript_24682/g.77637 Transcript_24682/m.77637 type:complete len:264 (-) Transcript_24682:106-897(-)